MKLSKLNIKPWAVIIGAALIWQSCGDKPNAKITEPEVAAIDLSLMDSTVSPADDFFRFVNGGWIAKTMIPSDRGAWGAGSELAENTNEVVLEVLESAAKSDKYAAGTDQRKAADFYAIGMDSLLAERAGTQPLQPHMEQIAAISDVADLQKYLSEQETYGGGAFFGFGVFPDLKNSKVMGTYLGQGGLGLPDRDYYTKQDGKSKEIREKYVKHVS